MAGQITSMCEASTRSYYKPTTWVSYDVRTFDTFASNAVSNALADYLNGLPNGVIIYGLTCDEATMELTTAARNALFSIGVDVSTLGYRGKLTFVATIGRPQSTVYLIANKGDNNLLMSATTASGSHNTIHIFMVNSKCLLLTTLYAIWKGNSTGNVITFLA